MSEWRYFARRLNGDGTETTVHTDLPLHGGKPVRVLSGPHQLTGDITIDATDFTTATGGPLLERRVTTLYAEDPNGRIWCGGILQDYTIDGPTVSLDISGFTTYAKDQPYDGDFNETGVDPLDVVRMLWGHLQDQPGGNIGLVLDGTRSGVTIGVPDDSTTASSTSTGQNVSFESGPVRINWWSSDDIGGVIDSLAKETPFDYLEEHELQNEVVLHTLRLGYPQLGARQTDLRFAYGENVFKAPTESYPAEDQVTEVWVYGAGEGRARLRGVAAVNRGLRYVKIIDDKTVTDQATADRLAREELALHQPELPGGGITELVVLNHPNAPLGSYDVGDTVLYVGDHDWGEVEVWVRIVKLTADPDAGDTVTATVVLADTIR